MKIAFDTNYTNGGSLKAGPNTEEDLPWKQVFIDDMLRSGSSSFLDLIHTSAVKSYDGPYIYPISLRYYVGYPSVQEFSEIFLERFKWLATSAVRDDIISGKCLVVIHDYMEAESVSPSEVDLWRDTLSSLPALLGANPKHFAYVNGNVHVSNYETPTSIRFFCFLFFELAINDFVVSPTSELTYRLEHSISKPKRFLSYSRHWNQYRQYVTFELYRRDLLSSGLVSCSEDDFYFKNLDPWDTRAKMFLRISGDNDLWKYDITDESEAQAENFLSRLPLLLDTPLDNNLAQTFNAQHYLDADISLINETRVTSHQLFLTEKTFKTIYAKHPFLIIGNPGSLKYLRSLGYETFSNVFDESYDEEVHAGKRIQMILSELERFCALDEKKRISSVAAMNEIAEHNFNVLLGRVNSKTEYFKLFGWFREVVAENTSKN